MDNRQRITLASFLAYFVMSAMLAPMPIISAPIAETFGTSIEDATAQFSWLTMGILVGAIVALVIFDFLRIRSVFLLVYTTILVCLLTLMFTDSLGAIGVALGIVGVCCGLGLAAAALVISRTYETERRASMLVITDASFSVAGFTFAAAATAFVVAGLHWATVYQLVATVTVAILLLALVSTFPSTAPARETTASQEAWPLPYWLCLGALFLYTLGQYSMLLWLPNYTQSQLGASADQAGRLVSMFWTGLFVAQLLVAWWVRRIGVQRLVLVAGTMTCLFSIPLWTTNAIGALPALAFLWGLANFGLLKVVLSFATQQVRLPTPRLVSALLLGATLGTAVSPWVTSRIVLATDNYFILQFSTACYAALAALLFFAVRTQKTVTAD